MNIILKLIIWEKCANKWHFLTSPNHDHKYGHREGGEMRLISTNIGKGEVYSWYELQIAITWIYIITFLL